MSKIPQQLNVSSSFVLYIKWWLHHPPFQQIRKLGITLGLLPFSFQFVHPILLILCTKHFSNLSCPFPLSALHLIWHYLTSFHFPALCHHLPIQNLSNKFLNYLKFHTLSCCVLSLFSPLPVCLKATPVHLFIFSLHLLRFPYITSFPSFSTKLPLPVSPKSLHTSHCLSSLSFLTRLWAPWKQGQLCLIHLYVLLQSCNIVGPQWTLLMLVNIFKSIWWYLWGPRQKRVLQRETSVKLSLSWIVSMDPLLS